MRFGISFFRHCLLPWSLCTTVAFVFAQTPTLKVDPSQTVVPVSPILYGLMTEEINYSYDGGLYAEMIRNRTFRHGWEGFQSWTIVQRGDAAASFAESKSGPSTALPASLQLKIENASVQSQAGIANDGYWGMAVEPRTVYKGSFYASTDHTDTALIRLISNATGAVLAETTTPVEGAPWKQYNFQMTSSATAGRGEANHFELTFHHKGNIQLQLVSLFPPTYHNRPNGNRVDLMERMAKMKPNFLRLPGGNYLEGNEIKDWYDWKKTIGPLVDRPTHPSPWGYQSTDGMGLLEFLEWCEDLQVEPVLAVYAGYSLHGEHVAGDQLKPYIQAALDEIEYVSGSTSTRWGSERAKNGHPEPFPLHFIEVGNEDEFDKSHSYDDRFTAFAEAIRAKYPQLRLIATTPVKKGHPDIIDDHYYRTPNEFFAMVHRYDTQDRKGPKVFVGEWATRTGSPTPDFGAALGDAAWMTSMERNSDLVIMASYAPLLVNVNPGGMQWSTDLIGYTASKSYASPSYWAQVLFASHLGSRVVSSAGTNLGPRFFWSATASDKTLHLKLVNASDRSQTLKLDLGNTSRQAALWTLHGNTRFDTNTLSDPHHIEPKQTKVQLTNEWTVPAYTIQVLDVPLK